MTKFKNFTRIGFHRMARQVRQKGSVDAMTTVSLYWLSVVGSARKFTSQTGSRIEYI